MVHIFHLLHLHTRRYRFRQLPSPHGVSKLKLSVEFRKTRPLSKFMIILWRFHSLGLRSLAKRYRTKFKSNTLSFCMLLFRLINLISWSLPSSKTSSFHWSCPRIQHKIDLASTPKSSFPRTNPRWTARTTSSAETWKESYSDIFWNCFKIKFLVPSFQLCNTLKKDPKIFNKPC